MSDHFPDFSVAFFCWLRWNFGTSETANSKRRTKQRFVIISSAEIDVVIKRAGTKWTVQVLKVFTEGCPIHPNRYDLSKAVCKSFYQKSIRGSCISLYRKSDKPSVVRWKPAYQKSICKKLRKHFASNCQGSLKMLSNRVDSIRVERLVSVKVDPSHRKTICKTLRKYSAFSYLMWWRCCRVASIRLESNDSTQLKV